MALLFSGDSSQFFLRESDSLFPHGDLKSCLFLLLPFFFVITAIFNVKKIFFLDHVWVTFALNLFLIMVPLNAAFEFAFNEESSRELVFGPSLEKSIQDTIVCTVAFDAVFAFLVDKTVRFE